MLRPLLTLYGSLVAATLGTSGPSEATLADRPAPAANTQPSAALPVAPVARAPRVEVGPSEPPLRVAFARSLLVAPRGCAGLKQTFDVLIHFHGAYTTTEPQLMKSGIDAVYVVKNLGNGSGPYESAFASSRAFDAELESIRARVDRACPGATRAVGRVALSGWSAGYGAIRNILARPEARARVDAVLLADGMHVGYEPGTRKLRTAAMAPFMGFAEAAARGEKLMAVTHSAIVPPTYASTTETARYIVKGLDLAPANERAIEPRPGMQQISNDRRGDLHVLGYAGADPRAHCDHLYGISSTLWSRLRDRWSTR